MKKRATEGQSIFRKRSTILLVCGIVAITAVTVLAVKHSRSRTAPSGTVEAPAVCEACPSVGSITFAPTVSNSSTAPRPAPEGMVWIPGGEFSMGSTVESESLCGLPKA
jgi:formylglycine-generating enzyme required for sulfatase activity